MIYTDKFLPYLKSIFNNNIKIRHKNIVIPCPWCEANKRKKHYHLWISLEYPRFRCFYAGCNVTGNIDKLLKKIEGKEVDISFVDETKIVKRNDLKFHKEKKDIYIPKINWDDFPMKTLYLKKRFSFDVNILGQLKGLVLDINEFIKENKINIDQNINNIKDFLHSNFIGFISEFGSNLILRNIDPNSSFRYYKLKLFDGPRFLDYYKISGNETGNEIILGEGIFDIYSEYLLNSLEKRSDTYLYACGFSSNYFDLVKSLVFNEQLFNLNLSILSDRDIKLDYYKKLKNYNSHIINKLTVFYNRTGKDFATTPIVYSKFIV